MAQHLTIARPYARAVFYDAVKNKLLTEWSEALQILALIAQDKAVIQLVSNPKLREEQRRELFCNLLQSVAAPIASKLGERLNNFISLLTEEKRLLVLPEIATLYHHLLIEEQGIVEADVVSAFPMSQDHREQIQTKLEARFKSNVRLNFIKDKTLIGGTLIRAGNWVMDDTIKGKLAKLADSLSG